MGYKDKIFAPLAKTKPQTQSGSAGKNLYTHKDPFDFYRSEPVPDRYIPITQRGLRKSFSNNLIEIEFFIEMATSLRPLIDEAQDIDEITRMFSQQKLASRPNPHSVQVLRNMIKDPNPEIALYAAEGLNTIENAFIERIIELRKKIADQPTRSPNLLLKLGKRYIEFAELLAGQELIRKFYIDEAIACLDEALQIKPNSYTILKKLGIAHLMKGDIARAIKILNKLINVKQNDFDLYLLLAECFYQVKDYDSLRHMAKLLSQSVHKLNTTMEIIVYQWTV